MNLVGATSITIISFTIKKKHFIKKLITVFNMFVVLISHWGITVKKYCLIDDVSFDMSRIF